MIVRDGSKLRRPFLDVSGRVDAGGERGLLSLAFAPGYARTGRFYVYYTDRAGDTRVVEYRRASAEQRRRRLGPRRARPGPAGAQPQRRPAAVRARRAALHRRSATAAARATEHGAAATPRTSGRCSGRSCASTRARAAVAPTACRARTRSSAATAPAPRSGRTACATRGGSRSTRAAATCRRRRRPERGRGGHSVVRRAGANLGWRPFEGNRRFTPGESRSRPRAARASSACTRAATARSPAASWCATRCSSALRGRYVFGDFCRGLIESRADPRRPRACHARDAARGADAVVVRRGRARAGLRDVARRARLPARPAVVLADHGIALVRAGEPRPADAVAARTRGSPGASRRTSSIPARRSTRTSTPSRPPSPSAAAPAGSRSRTTTATTPTGSKGCCGGSATSRSPRREPRPAGGAAAARARPGPRRLRLRARGVHRRRGARRGQRVRLG